MIKQLHRRIAAHVKIKVKGLCLVFGLLAFRQHNSDFSFSCFCWLATTWKAASCAEDDGGFGCC